MRSKESRSFLKLHNIALHVEKWRDSGNVIFRDSKTSGEIAVKSIVGVDCGSGRYFVSFYYQWIQTILDQVGNEKWPLASKLAGRKGGKRNKNCSLNIENANVSFFFIIKANLVHLHMITQSRRLSCAAFHVTCDISISWISQTLAEPAEFSKLKIRIDLSRETFALIYQTFAQV